MLQPLQPTGALPPSPLALPFAETLARAGLSGFPSPAEEYAARTLDLNERFVLRPSATFYMESRGDSMLEFGIPDGCLLLVDRSINARPGHIVVALVEGEIVVKRWERRCGIDYLVSGGNRYPPIALASVEGEIWGVVRSVHVDVAT